MFLVYTNPFMCNAQCQDDCLSSVMTLDAPQRSTDKQDPASLISGANYASRNRRLLFIGSLFSMTRAVVFIKLMPIQDRFSYRSVDAYHQCSRQLYVIAKT